MMLHRCAPVLDFKACSLIKTASSPLLLLFNSVPMHIDTSKRKHQSCSGLFENVEQSSEPMAKSIVMKAKGPTRTESPKIRNRRVRKKFDGSAKRPRLSVFCSDRQLYAMLVDDHNKKCLFYGSTLQRSMREDPPCTRIEAAKRVGEELVRVCKELNINEISSYDRNGFACGEKMQAFEIAVYEHGFLPR